MTSDTAEIDGIIEVRQQKANKYQNGCAGRKFFPAVPCVWLIRMGLSEKQADPRNPRQFSQFGRALPANCVIEVLSLHARGMVLHFASDRFQHPSQFSLFAIADADNALLLGPPGVGKTQLAVGIGMKACALGHSTVFITAAGLIGSLVQAHQENRIEEKTKLWFSRRY